MNDLGAFLGDALAALVGSGVLIGPLGFLASRFIINRQDVALKQMADRNAADLERLKADLSRDNAVALERLRAQLASESAIRQEVARARLSLYGELVREGMELEQLIIVTRNQSTKDTAPVIDALNALRNRVRANEHLMPYSVAVQFMKHSEDVLAVFRKQGHGMEVWDEFHKAWPPLLDVLRRDLYIPSAVPSDAE